MTVKECYEAMEGSYDEIVGRLRTDERIAKFLRRVAEDGSYALLVNSFAENNIAEAFRAAHTLKGVCMNLSLTRFGKSASDLTEALRGKAEFGADAADLLEKVKTDYALTVKCISELDPSV